MSELGWIVAVYYPLAVTSAVLPWVNAELLMLSAVPLAENPSGLATLVCVVTAGQMTGKGAMFWIARLSQGSRRGRFESILGRWQTRLVRRPRSTVAVVLVSAVVGLPPFYVVSMAAGALGVAFGRFLAIGSLGRLIHFGAIAFVPHLMWGGL